MILECGGREYSEAVKSHKWTVGSFGPLKVKSSEIRDAIRKVKIRMANWVDGVCRQDT